MVGGTVDLIWMVICVQGSSDLGIFKGLLSTPSERKFFEKGAWPGSRDP